jgi:ketosteroid isomerase-like protein
MTDRATVADWVGRYITAWDSNAPADIRALFAPDGSYRFHPWDEPVVGHDAITAAWLDAQDDVGDHTFVWEILALDGDTAVVQGRTTHSDGDVYDNLWVLRLGADGTATAFTEWFMEPPTAD